MFWGAPNTVLLRQATKKEVFLKENLRDSKLWMYLLFKLKIGVAV